MSLGNFKRSIVAIQLYNWVRQRNLLGYSATESVYEYALFPLSNGIGALINGWMVDIAGYVGMFLILATVQAAGLVFAQANASKVQSATN